MGDGGVLGPDNCIYGTPSHAGQVLQISIPNGPALSSDGFIPADVGNSANKGTKRKGYEDFGNDKLIAAGLGKLSVSERVNRLSVEIGYKFKERPVSTRKKLEAIEIDLFGEKQSGNVMARIKKLEEELDLVSYVTIIVF